jgi:hypothetical protein
MGQEKRIEREGNEGRKKEREREKKTVTWKHETNVLHSTP